MLSAEAIEQAHDYGRPNSVVNEQAVGTPIPARSLFEAPEGSLTTISMPGDPFPHDVDYGKPNSTPEHIHVELI